MKYSKITAEISGIESVELTATHAVVCRLGEPALRIPLDACPPLSKRSAFTFADAAYAAERNGIGVKIA